MLVPKLKWTTAKLKSTISSFPICTYVLACWTSPVYYVSLLYVFLILGTYQLICTTSDTEKAQLQMVLLQHTMGHPNHGHTGAVMNLITTMTPV
jgi:hypothetical protein